MDLSHHSWTVSIYSTSLEPSHALYISPSRLCAPPPISSAACSAVGSSPLFLTLLLIALPSAPHPPPRHRRPWWTSRLPTAPRMTCSSTFSPSPLPPPAPRSTWGSTVEPPVTTHSPLPPKPLEVPHSLILLPSQHGRDVPDVGVRDPVPRQFIERRCRL
jgi:hypothetical protein